MKASVIIPTFNKLPRLKLVLASLNNQKIPNEMYEVILIDDGSKDDTIKYLENLNPSFQFTYLSTKNSGRSAARNLGASIAQNNILIFIDDDVILHPEFIEEHLKLQKEKLRVIHGKIINLTYLKFFEDPTNGVMYANLSEGKSKMTINSDLKRLCIAQEDIIERFTEIEKNNKKITSLEIAIRSILNRQPSNLSWIGCTGGNFSVPKEWFQRVGGFDQAFGLRWGGEDFELGYRFFKEGYLFFYSDLAVNYHIAHFRQDFREDLIQAFDYFYAKHNDKYILKLRDFLLGNMKMEELLID